MAIEVTRDERRRWLLARASGVLGFEETATFLRTVREPIEYRMWPLLFDARGCATDMTEADVERAAAIVRETAQRQRRGHVAVVADQDPLYRWLLLYETKVAAAGVRLIRIFRQFPDAERWLDIVNAARELI
ncbi:MAG TPA: hypothetical protein VKE51_01805 [Vicinamibacterales bacterium]|nr:hypothetical protein [Vicinamibacterales bacterium]